MNMKMGKLKLDGSLHDILQNLKIFSLEEFQLQERDNLAPYFDRAIAKLKQFT